MSSPATHARAPARERLATELARARVYVLGGGRSSERAVSSKTAAAVAVALRAGEPGETRTAAVELVEIDESGLWQGTAPAAWLARAPRDAVFFLGLHGGEGEDGTLQGLLAGAGFVFTGSGVAASALCLDKHRTKLVLGAAGIASARASLVDRRRWAAARPRVVAEIASFGGAGWSVKPNRGGSSVATTLLAAGDDPGDAIERVLATGDAALVEARVHGTETTVGVLGNASGELVPLTPVEIVPEPDRFFDYQQKYDAAGAAEHCPPRSLDRVACDRLRELALLAHRSAGCDGYSRTDFIVPRDAAGRAGEPVVLEINTLPGMTDRSLLPLAARTDGIGFRDLCLEILALALERAGAR